MARHLAVAGADVRVGHDHRGSVQVKMRVEAFRRAMGQVLETRVAQSLPKQIRDHRLANTVVRHVDDRIASAKGEMQSATAGRQVEPQSTRKRGPHSAPLDGRNHVGRLPVNDEDSVEDESPVHAERHELAAGRMAQKQPRVGSKHPGLQTLEHVGRFAPDLVGDRVEMREKRLPRPRSQGAGVDDVADGDVASVHGRPSPNPGLDLTSPQHVQVPCRGF